MHNSAEHFASSVAVLLAAATLSFAQLISDDLIVCFALATLGSFGAMGLAKNTRHMIWEAVAGVCIGTAGAWVLLRMNAQSPFPELTALIAGVGGLMVPITIRQNVGSWIVDLKNWILRKQKDPPPTIEPGEPPIKP